MAQVKAKSRKKTAVTAVPKALEADDLELLRQAFDTLEHPSLAARISNVVGTPIEIVAHLLPKKWYRAIHETAEKAIAKALDTAVSTMRRHHEVSAHETYYRALVAGSGGVGGLLGLPGIIVELPVTTTLMLRGIAEIARDEGEDMDSIEARMACVQVFALGGRSEIDDAAETGYYGVRLALSGYLSSVSAHVARHGLGTDASPLLLQVAHAVASRFGIVVSQRTAMQIMPVISAVSAAAVNTIFMQHFQHMARAHFTVRRLERKYDKDFVRSQYESLKNEN
jgi:hypothetical protein